MRETGSAIGQRLLRKEDPRLLRGEGCYVADLRLADMLHAAIVRSPHAHARIRAIESSAAAMPEVGGVYRAADLGPLSRSLPQTRPHPALLSCTAAPLARRKVKYVGEAVAVVVAASRYAAEDAAEAVRVDYEPLAPVTDVEQAVRPGAPVVHDDADFRLGDNIAANVRDGYGDVAAALAGADLVIRERLRIHRSGGQSIETRGVLAAFDAATSLLTVWSSTQQPHFLRSILAEMLALPEERIRVVAPDVGGGFGSKGSGYVEDVLIASLALRLQRPVRWIEDRRESLMCAHQEHEQVHELEVGVRRDGRIVALRDRILADTGAYVPKGVIVPLLTLCTLPGPYRIPAYAAELTVAYSNRVPVAPVRGAGRPPAVAVMELVLNRIAREVGCDALEVRRRNLLQPADFPYAPGLQNESGYPIRYDSGDYPGLLEKVAAAIDHEAFRGERERLRRAGRFRGIGFSLSVEATGMGPYEGARLVLDSAGKATVFTGAATQGQGSLTTLAQVCAAELDMPFEDVTVVAGDTAMISKGAGAYASRIATVAATATSFACRQLMRRLGELAAAQLEARPEDLELIQEDGVARHPRPRERFTERRFRVRGSPQRSVSIESLVRAQAGLEETAFYEPQDEAWASGAQAAVVEVDAGSGEVRVLRYAAVHDCGVMLNPMIVEGQVMGGIAHGIGETLYERMVYDEQGQYLSASLMDFTMPSACEVPSVAILHQETPSPLSPLGVKGAGEGGTIGACGAILGAVEDALAPFGVRLRSSPLTPEGILRAIKEARENLAEAA
ncbi:MAG: xanthine dehydrogenase family protein molybdopterin-binding subunit [Candidatus Tectomicrobia bacterium]|nr:xanthine dehydrogenase family protein molybdopterin-binding subunit [Candidatus Tectomicrobia bacterium]